ncbi:MAG TPA: CHAD domain-containing protein [Steroidobacteraceae bacterium]|nr:CHAD domain-containing protein [Steroidobacteraceae bacterium]
MPPRPHRSARGSVPAPARTSAARGAGNGSGGEAREVEWQLAAPDLAGVQRWLEQHANLDDLRIEPLPVQHLHDAYLDTEDWRVFRAGFALRLRQKEGGLEATLKGLRSARKEVADRREISEPLPHGASQKRIKALAQATGPVGRRVRDVAGVKPLRVLFEVQTSRSRFAVRGRHAGPPVGEIALDEARFSRANGHRRPMILTRVELEAADPDQATALERLAQRLCAECGLSPATENKFAAGLRSAALEPPRLGDSDRSPAPVQPAIDPATSAGDFAASALRRLLEEWRAHEPAARLGEGAAALHALRITGRRMDTVLGLFKDHLPAAVVKGRPKLKALVDALGNVRDVDIRLDLVTQFRRTLPEEDRQALDPLLRQLELERDAARSGMLRALDTKPAREWLDRLPDQLARSSPTSSRSTRSTGALRVVPDLIRKRYRKLRKCARRLTPESSLREHHKVRIRAKKLRYALEVVAPVYARAADDMLAALHELQSKLGTQHDAGDLAGYLTRLATRPPAGFNPQTLFIMGRMAQLHAREAARLSGRIEKPWRKVHRKRWQGLRSRMEELRELRSPEAAGAPGQSHAQGPNRH